MIGFSLGQMTQSNIHPWYQELSKSSLTPPGVIFSIVWSVLYALLAVVGWALGQYRHDPKLKPIFYLYLVQLIMNWAWTPLFFQLHWLGVSFFWIVVMTCLNGVLIFKIKNQKKGIAILLSPYFFWLLFAAYLNAVIWDLN